MFTLKVDDIHVHVHTVDFDRILRGLGELAKGNAEILAQGAALMSKVEDIQAQVTSIRGGVTSIGESLANVAADIDRIKADISGGLTASEADAVNADLTELQTKVQGVADAASALAESNPDPAAPPVEG